MKTSFEKIQVCISKPTFHLFLKNNFWFILRWKRTFTGSSVCRHPRPNMKVSLQRKNLSRGAWFHRGFNYVCSCVAFIAFFFITNRHLQYDDIHTCCSCCCSPLPTLPFSRLTLSLPISIRCVPDLSFSPSAQLLPQGSYSTWSWLVCYLKKFFRIFKQPKVLNISSYQILQIHFFVSTFSITLITQLTKPFLQTESRNHAFIVN